MNDRLPFVDACGACPVSGVCNAANTHERCNDPVLYPVGGLHPIGQPVPQLRVSPPPPVSWSQISERFETIAASLSGTEVRDATALTLQGTLRLLQGRAAVPGQAVIAVMFGPDQELEKAWRIRHLLSHDLGIPVVAPAFSTWLDTTPYEHIAQSVRTITMATQLAMYNHVVPSIALSPWVKPEMWAASLADAPQVAVDLGSVDRWRWPMYIELLRVHANAFSPMPRLLVYGVLNLGRVTDVVNAWPAGITFISRGVVDYARKGERLSATDLTPFKDWDESPETLFPHNDQVYRSLVSDVMLRQRNIQQSTG